MEHRGSHRWENLKLTVTAPSVKQPPPPSRYRLLLPPKLRGVRTEKLGVDDSGGLVSPCVMTPEQTDQPLIKIGNLENTRRAVVVLPYVLPLAWLMMPSRCSLCCLDVELEEQMMRCYCILNGFRAGLNISLSIL
ncbi:hypothetical protein CDAR_369331 [Caerostris darwini]|uniref:Uncharacterized protein n=1 Tax=Caerostris darwini TaxID=1538125 RepID=A0AAV4RYH9_9ARAC|nr:hypothetical protein CDAR_369331 [Caerostris darwini]